MNKKLSVERRPLVLQREALRRLDLTNAQIEQAAGGSRPTGSFTVSVSVSLSEPCGTTVSDSITLPTSK